MSLILFVGLALPLAAQNLVPNPDLDNDDAGWVEQGGSTAAWILVDADACHIDGGSGGLNLGAVLDTGVYSALAQGGCFPVVPNQNFCYGMKYILGGQFVNLRAITYIDNDCQVPTGGFLVILGSQSAAFTSLLECVTVPPAVTSIRLAAESSGSEASGSFTMIADRFYAGARYPLLLDGFETGSFCRWSSSVP